MKKPVANLVKSPGLAEFSFTTRYISTTANIHLAISREFSKSEFPNVQYQYFFDHDRRYGVFSKVNTVIKNGG